MIRVNLQEPLYISLKHSSSLIKENNSLYLKTEETDSITYQTFGERIAEARQAKVHVYCLALIHWSSQSNKSRDEGLNCYDGLAFRKWHLQRNIDPLSNGIINKVHYLVLPLIRHGEKSQKEMASVDVFEPLLPKINFSFPEDLFQFFLNINDKDMLEQWGPKTIKECYENYEGIVSSKLESKNSPIDLAIYYHLAILGYPFAQHNVGMFYQNGMHYVPDFKIAFEWYQKAANQNFALAQCALGNCFKGGIGVEKDHKFAFEWFHKAASQGNAEAQYELGACYHHGIGCDRDPKNAMIYYIEAIIQGNAAAQFAMGLCFEKGDLGCDQNYKTAFEWFSKAAIKKDANAQHFLGHYYKEGLGCERDPARSIDYYTQSAINGHMGSQHYLSVCFLGCMGYQRNLKAAVEWSAKSAAQNYAPGQYILGLCHEINHDYQGALKWYRKAAIQGNQDARAKIEFYYKHRLGIREDDALETTCIIS